MFYFINSFRITEPRWCINTQWKACRQRITDNVYVRSRSHDKVLTTSDQFSERRSCVSILIIRIKHELWTWEYYAVHQFEVFMTTLFTLFVNLRVLCSPSVWGLYDVVVHFVCELESTMQSISLRSLWRHCSLCLWTWEYYAVHQFEVFMTTLLFTLFVNLRVLCSPSVWGLHDDVVHFVCELESTMQSISLRSLWRRCSLCLWTWEYYAVHQFEVFMTCHNC